MKKTLIALLILITAAVTMYYAFPERVAGYMLDFARARVGLVKKQIKIDDHNIVYLEGGKGTSILLLHGYTAEKDNWLQFAAYLIKDYHIVIPDIPGYGESSQFMDKHYDLNSQINRLHEFAKKIDLRKFHIAGNSMGGLFAGVYAARYPDEVISVGLFDSAGVMPLKINAVMKMMAKGENPLVIRNSDDWPRTMRLIFVNPPSLPYPLKKVFIEKAVANLRFYEKALADIKPGFFSLEKQLPQIKAPTLILWGDHDQVLDISSVPVFEKGIKNHQTVIIKDCGHVPQVEKPGETATHYLNFIKNMKN